jgi:hypothetical protein
LACLEGALAPASSSSAVRLAQALLHLMVSLRSMGAAVEGGACGLLDLSALHPLAAWWWWGGGESKDQRGEAGYWRSAARAVRGAACG